MWRTLVPIAISVLALVVALTTLWKTHLTRFRLIAASGPMTMRIHRFRSDGESWLLPHFVASLSFTNGGAQLGRVLDLRLIVRYPDLPIKKAYETFRLHGQYDRKGYDKHSSGRLKMIDEARLDDGVPFVILPKSTVTKFLLFDTRWERPVRQNNLEVELEVLTDKSRQWRVIEAWPFSVGGGMWRELEESGTSLDTFPKRYFEQADQPSINPTDLHKYTQDPDVVAEAESATPFAPSYETLSRRRRPITRRKDRA
jgi:hypothetical protein